MSRKPKSPSQGPKRGAIPTPRSVLEAAIPYLPPAEDAEAETADAPDPDTGKKPEQH